MLTFQGESKDDNEHFDSLFNKIMQKEEWLKYWDEGMLIKSLKKVDLMNCDNKRGITLLNVSSKILIRIILGRMKTVIEKNYYPNRQYLQVTVHV